MESYGPLGGCDGASFGGGFGEMGGGDIGGAGAATFGGGNSQPMLRDSGACLGVVSCCPLEDGNGSHGYDSPTRQDATEEFWYAQRRCQRCRKAYTEADNRDPSNECTFHSGHFEEPGSRKIATVMGWSCCKNVTPNPRDMEVDLRAAYYNIRGCKVAPKHKEDEHFSRLLASFPYDPNASREAHIARVLEAQALAKEKTPKQPEVPSMEGCIAHTISSRDTLQGLALYYDTTIAAIRQSTVTRQPVKEPVSKSKLVSRFLSAIAGKIDESEALFYLEQADWSFESAVQQYKEDCQWELDHSGLDKP